MVISDAKGPQHQRTRHDARCAQHRDRMEERAGAGRQPGEDPLGVAKWKPPSPLSRRRRGRPAAVDGQQSRLVGAEDKGLQLALWKREPVLDLEALANTVETRAVE